MDIKAYVIRAKNEDKQALLELIMQKQDEYYKLAYVYLKNRHDALDAIQDMTLILYNKIGKLKKDESFYSWSKTILVNCCKTILKNRNRIDSTELFDVEQRSKDQEDGIVLENTVNKLSEKHQEIIRLKYYLDMDNDTISKILKIPLGTVKSRSNAALNKLKIMMEGSGYDGY
ncbi:RNA polymerase sigma factor [Alkalibacter saccharofermentans]|uniref:RNA polymerase sigma-70 factor, ECF subfamily n=1 Tax=Alkalibacter saccharofermentans DSM 14828 TaxID=1120975 RepID=A0A1M4YIR9_9FIRM|nr:RNA polymerase sigma factor [Alkalibacter saccharofermentans]SHF05667.1 RNA polymerase sigma-70 factor, ECF subfamily [Alkalibacter saccharofermentans DSM 14828]